VSQWFLRFVFDRPLNALRAELGLPPARDQLWAHARNADLNLGVWSTLFRGPQPRDPANCAIVGFPWYDRDHTQQVPSRELDEFFAAGAAPLVFALGSTGVHAAGQFFEHAVAAAEALRSRALLVVGRDQPPPANLPGDGSIKAVAYAPFSTAFRGASVIVHHGGVGTTAQSLAAARPVLVTPMAHDQFDNAARVVRLGVGEGLPFADVNARRLTALLERLTHEPRYAGVAAVLGPKIVAEDGAKRAAQLIDERFARALSRRSLPLV
jgi:UDP:flavonoid glycosyltransferase YjiC (YdhE family)